MTAPITTATFDTNVLRDKTAALIRRAANVGITAVVVEVTDREVKGTCFQREADTLNAIAETSVWAPRAFALDSGARCPGAPHFQTGRHYKRPEDEAEGAGTDAGEEAMMMESLPVPVL
jgi:hypothetical protein